MKYCGRKKSCHCQGQIPQECPQVFSDRLELWEDEHKYINKFFTNLKCWDVMTAKFLLTLVND